MLWETGYSLYRGPLESWLRKGWRRRCEKAWSHSRKLGHWGDRKLVWHIRETISRPMSIWIRKSCTVVHRVLGGSSRLLLIFALLSMPISRHLVGAPVQKPRWRLDSWCKCGNKTAFLYQLSVKTSRYDKDLKRKIYKLK